MHIVVSNETLPGFGFPITRLCPPRSFLSVPLSLHVLLLYSAISPSLIWDWYLKTLQGWKILNFRQPAYVSSYKARWPSSLRNLVVLCYVNNFLSADLCMAGKENAGKGLEAKVVRKRQLQRHLQIRGWVLGGPGKRSMGVLSRHIWSSGSWSTAAWLIDNRAVPPLTGRWGRAFVFIAIGGGKGAPLLICSPWVSTCALQCKFFPFRGMGGALSFSPSFF